MSDVRIYYENEVYTGPVVDIPSPLGVMALVCRTPKNCNHDVGRLVLHTSEYYVLEEGHWFGLQNVVDLVDHVLFRKPEIVLKGRWMRDSEYEKILKDASTFYMGDWPEKNGIYKYRERGE